MKYALKALNVASGQINLFKIEQALSGREQLEKYCQIICNESGGQSSLKLKWTYKPSTNADSAVVQTHCGKVLGYIR
ncbi:hypothetical protein [Dyadobacter sp. CY326]|uniref:hypothetical protein n=1 Tax=Dyadobacter sp. CY326 TaxID=2907300 RepID=UPI001F15F433|nr:hypothetical protein [Dyadobacter sp. CY326]MCE7067186.1 hypothetical protein [Dyadobacter sp. CY326]